MARDFDVYAMLLDDQGERQRIFFRFRPNDGYFEGLRDLDDIGEITPLPGRVVGTVSSACRCDCKNEKVPEWLTSLKDRMKGTR